MKNDFSSIGTRKIRIISGKWRGRKIPVVNKLAVRPTTSRIREILFNWLNPFITHAICLDCFTGSGALGLESLSRGAQKVTCIDKNYECVASLKKTVNTFNDHHNIEIIHSDCQSWLKKSNNTYDIIFIDPPFYNSSIILEVISLLEQYYHFQKKSWIYIETSRSQKFLKFFNFPKNWFLYRQKSTHFLSIFLYYREYPDSIFIK